MQNKDAINLGTKLPYQGKMAFIIIAIMATIIITSTIKSIRGIHRGSNS